MTENATHYRDAWRSAIYDAIGDYVKTQRAMELAELNGLFDPVDTLARPAPVLQCEAEPVAWRWVNQYGDERFTSTSEFARQVSDGGFDVQPLYATPPSRLDAENAEAIIEAAGGLVEEIATSGTHTRWKKLANAIASHNEAALSTDPGTVAVASTQLETP